MEPRAVVWTALPRVDVTGVEPVASGILSSPVSPDTPLEGSGVFEQTLRRAFAPKLTPSMGSFSLREHQRRALESTLEPMPPPRTN